MAVLALLFMAQPVMGQQPTPTPQPQQKEHVVKPGDTLWDLARQYLNDPFRWPLIYQANKDVVANPHRIYPAERLVIPGLEPDVLGVAIDQQAQQEPARGIQRSRFYVPVSAGVPPTLISSERESLNLVQAREWFGAPWISDSASLGINARVIMPADVRSQNDRLRQQFHPRDELILNTLHEGIKAGDRLLAVRLSRNLRGHGWVVEPKGVMLVDSVAPTRANVTITTQYGDLMVGDLAIPLPAAPAMPADMLTEVSGGPVGEILEILNDQPLVGTAEYLFVTLGGAQGLTIGDELLAYIPERRVNEKSPNLLPEQEIARLRVIKVADRTVTARVIGLKTAALVKGLPVRVARKAP
jgi:hypothetical protein